MDRASSLPKSAKTNFFHMNCLCNNTRPRNSSSFYKFIIVSHIEINLFLFPLKKPELFFFKGINKKESFYYNYADITLSETITCYNTASKQYRNLTHLVKLLQSKEGNEKTKSSILSNKRLHFPFNSLNSPQLSQQPNSG